VRTPPIVVIRGSGLTIIQLQDWTSQDWKMTAEVAGMETAGLDNDRIKTGDCRNEGLENDGL